MFQEAQSLLAEHWMPLVQASSLVVFLVVGALHPRLPQGIFISATLVNLVTGALLYLFRIGLAVAMGQLASTGLVDGATLGPGWCQFALSFLLLDFAVMPCTGRITGWHGCGAFTGCTTPRRSSTPLPDCVCTRLILCS